MGNADYSPGEMDISDQKSTWNGFMKASAFAGLLTLVGVAFLTFTFAMQMDWLLSLVICLVAGVAIGFVMNLGSAWMIAMVLFAVTTVVFRIFIAIFTALT